MNWQTGLLWLCAVLVAYVLGRTTGNRKPRHRPYNDPRCTMNAWKNYWRT